MPNRDSIEPGLPGNPHLFAVFREAAIEGVARRMFGVDE
jgi:hypothetical protein